MKNLNPNGPKFFLKGKKLKKVKNNWILIVCVLLLVISLVFNFSNTNFKSSEEYNKIDSLNKILKNIELNQQKLDSTIQVYNKEIKMIDQNISKIKSDKILIMKQYNEKINRVNSFNTNQLDSFFTDRYK